MAIADSQSGQPVEIEFRIRDRDCFFVDASGRAECRVQLEHVVNRSDGQLLEYFTIEDAVPDGIRTSASDAPAITDARLVRQGVDGCLFEFIVSGPCVTTTLADTGAITQSVTATDGVGTVVATVPAHVEVRHVIETFCNRHDRAEFVRRHDTERAIPVQTEHGRQVTLTDALTDKQLEVLQMAYLSGYFDWPRKSTAQECADALGIAQPTFSQHIRAAQEKIFTGLFEDSTRERARPVDPSR